MTYIAVISSDFYPESLFRSQRLARLLVVSNKTELQEFCQEAGCDFMPFPPLDCETQR